MKRYSYNIDAVVRRPDTTVGALDAARISVLGCGMRQAMPMLLGVIDSCGSYAVGICVSEIEATVTVPIGDANDVIHAVSALI